jgi:tRNA pseudouridine38-40 synthase
VETSSLNTSSQRFALGIEYDGTAYNGWQIQPHAPSIQAALNSALSVVANASVECTGAGRTDSGVHATGQVAHFDTSAVRPEHSWLQGLNSNLPADINVLWVRAVSDNFHARFSAVSRSYEYVILNRPVRSALLRQRAWWVYRPLDHESMQIAANFLLGEHDFSSFRASSCQARSAIRTFASLSVRRDGHRIRVACRANAFLHHMVRNIVGSLVRIGQGDEDAAWMRQILESQDRKLSGVTAPAVGLTLTGVSYPAELLPDEQPPVTL